MVSFLFGLFIGAIGVVVAIFFVYKKNKKKINEALLIVADNSLTTEQKIAKIKELFKIKIWNNSGDFANGETSNLPCGIYIRERI